METHNQLQYFQSILYYYKSRNNDKKLREKETQKLYNRGLKELNQKALKSELNTIKQKVEKEQEAFR